MDSQLHSFDPEVPQPDRDEQTLDAARTEADVDDLPHESADLRGVQEASREDVADQELVVEFDEEDVREQ